MNKPKLENLVTTRIPTKYGDFQLHLFFEPDTGKEHMAFTLGDLAEGNPPLIRIHSECFTGDVLGSLRCDCGPQLEASMQMVSLEKRGAVIYLRQEGRGIGLIEKLKAYNLQDAGMDTVDANEALGHCADCRDYEAGAFILNEMGLKDIRLITNNPAKIVGLEDFGINVIERVPIEMEILANNRRYLETKAVRMNHFINLNKSG